MCCGCCGDNGYCIEKKIRHNELKENYKEKIDKTDKSTYYENTKG